MSLMSSSVDHESQADPALWRADETERRNSIWNQLGGGKTVLDTTAAAVREAGILAGYRGVYASKDPVGSQWSPSGYALGFLDLGSKYANELSNEGVIYHYPKTKRPGHDKSEISAIHASHGAGLPVFVVARGDHGVKSRKLFRGYIEALDDQAGMALITFANDGKLPPPPAADEAESPFALQDEDAALVWSKRRARPNQARFAFDVAARYGTACAVCGISVKEALEAAHLRPKSKSGSDDARNGLMLCRNHHRMFDSALFGIHPGTGTVSTHEPYELSDLFITAKNLAHLPAQPHPDALQDAWERWTKSLGK